MSKNFAMVFPGQGSQSVGMLDAWGTHPVVQETLREASEALGENLAALIHTGPKEVLALTTNTQPAMLVTDVAAWRVWRAEGGALPAAVAGHSLGEYAALVAAGVLTLAQAVPLVRLRASAMQQAVPVGTGGMAAVLGLEAARVVAVCAQVHADTKEAVEAVNFNDPLQTVIAGSKAGVEQACVALKAAGARRALALPVSAPFHSSLMQPAAKRLREALATLDLAAPQIPVINNVDVAVQHDAEAIRDALCRQAWQPVRWVECIQALAARGISHVIECGPGKALMGMTQRIAPELVSGCLYDPATLTATQELLA